MEDLEAAEQIFYEKENYIETKKGNKISKQSILCGSRNIVVDGMCIIMQGAILRGDLAKIKMGKYNIIRENAVIRPPIKKFRGGIAYFPIEIADYVVIEEEAVVNATSIGSFVHIGRGCVIGARTIIHPCSKIEDGAIVPADSVIAPYSIWSGFPATPLNFFSFIPPLLLPADINNNNNNNNNNNENNNNNINNNINNNDNVIDENISFGKANYQITSSHHSSLLCGEFELPECWNDLQKQLVEYFYANFLAKSIKK